MTDILPSRIRPPWMIYADRTISALAWIGGVIMIVSGFIGWRIPITTFMDQYPRLATFFIGVILISTAPDAYRYTTIIYGRQNNGTETVEVGQ